MINNKVVIWLSHIINKQTPGYSGVNNFKVIKEKSIEHGDSCNQASIHLQNHFGTHVDVPLHFIQDARSVDSYYAKDWIFNTPILIDIPTGSLGEVNNESFETLNINEDVDLLLLRTGFERVRQKEIYWKSSPIFNSNIIDFLSKYYPNLKAVAIDTISLTSLNDRKMGRECHRAALSKNIRIFEDVAMAHISAELNRVIALPLNIEGADGAPVTMIGFLNG